MRKKIQIWKMLYLVITKLLPCNDYFPPARFIRGFFARRICESVGTNVNVERGAIFSEFVTLGNNSGIGIDCELHGEVHIGDDVMMAPECVFYTRNHKTKLVNVAMNRQGATEPRPICIGNDVWIGRRAMFMPGATIGNHCIVAAGAVVTKSFPDYSVLGGVPARVISSRL